MASSYVRTNVTLAGRSKRSETDVVSANGKYTRGENEQCNMKLSMLVESRCLPISRLPLLRIWGWLASGMGMSGMACVTCHKPVWRANSLVMACGNNDLEKIGTQTRFTGKCMEWTPHTGQPLVEPPTTHCARTGLGLGWLGQTGLSTSLELPYVSSRNATERLKSRKHHKNRANGPYEYEFEWSAYLDGTLYNTKFSSVLELRRIYHRGREFLEAIQYVKLSDKQIGNIRLPFYEDTNFEDHENPELTVISNAAIPQIAKILAAWDQQHSAMQSLSIFTGSKHINRVQKSSEWMVALGLALTPGLEAVLAPANIRLLQYKSLAHLHHEERLARVTGIGSALLHFLVVQHELKEPLNLNGDLVNDLWDNSVITCGGDGKAALQAMPYSVWSRTRSSTHWRPPLYRRLRNSQFASTEAIAVTVSKHKAEEQLEGLKEPKRSKLEEPKKVKAQQKTKNPGEGINRVAPGNNRRILPWRKPLVTAKITREWGGQGVFYSPREPLCRKYQKAHLSGVSERKPIKAQAQARQARTAKFKLR
ncbi:hypothetical protein B0H16DRAFT_1469979 [Mycena metata]|uniref:Uncharacterized protein n=1 Tax=Mycena metata TaxID=1033252 RepID=A0AAD7MRM2_9AGAR|nr:hypothetical protein B0H16DRAFT_1469979 [Mycena metata]